MNQSYEFSGGGERILKEDEILINNHFILPKTDSSPLKIANPRRKHSYSNHPCSGAKLLLVSGRGPLPKDPNVSPKYGITPEGLD